MKQPRLEQSPIDHHIQAHILQVLFRHGKVVSFSELKPDDVQNSLFMYHMSKLEGRGLVERSADGFTITSSGARWVNFVSPERLKPRLSPRVLIKFLIFSPDRSQILISKRKSAAAEHLNQYLLPSGLQKYGVSFQDSAQTILRTLTGESSTLKDLGVHEMIHRYGDDYIHHTVSPFYEAIMNSTTFPDDEHYELQWVSREEAKAGAFDASIAEVLLWYQAGQSFAGKTFDITVK